MRPLIYLILLSLFSTAHYSVFAGELTPIVDGLYRFSGAIAADDVGKFSQIPGTADPVHPTFVRISSTGGDVFAALKIARLIQQKQFVTLIRDRDPCYSACVIMFAAGVNRLPNENMGIHRIYTVSTRESYKDKNTRLDRVEREAKEIFRQSGVSSLLWDEMQKVPSEKLRILTFEEMENLGLVGNSPSFEDFKENRIAENIGITRPELIKRQQQAERTCRKPPNLLDHENMTAWVQCYQAIVHRNN